MLYISVNCLLNQGLITDLIQNLNSALDAILKPCFKHLSVFGIHFLLPIKIEVKNLVDIPQETQHLPNRIKWLLSNNLTNFPKKFIILR